MEKEASNASKERDKSGWQAKKSAMMRDNILDAALDCFVTIGYANTTTARIAATTVRSNSICTMLHHFPSKAELMRAAVEYLHSKLIELYASHIGQIPLELPVDERNRRGLESYWNYLSSDLYVAYHELCVAGRTDPELQDILPEMSQILPETLPDQRSRGHPQAWGEHLSRGVLRFSARDRGR